MGSFVAYFVDWLNGVFRNIPMEFLEILGRFGMAIGAVLAVLAYGRFTFRAGDRWAFGRERQEWNAKAMGSFLLTMVCIIGFGYIGSHIVIVPGAQTLESLKDVSVFVCIMLFGYPAFLAVVPAYVLSDMIEGVPPMWILAWLPGYFINPSYHWIAYQLFGRNPDFRKAAVWGKYLGFVIFTQCFYPEIWGYICGPMSGSFPAEISYRVIVPAVLMTLSLTWLLAPFTLLWALPLARKCRLFWAEIPGHVQVLRKKEVQWESGEGGKPVAASGIPIRLLVAGPFIALVIFMAGLVAFFTLKNGEASSHNLAVRLHHELADKIQMQVDDALAVPGQSPQERAGAISGLLSKNSIAKAGRAFIVDRSGAVIASSGAAAGDPVIHAALQALWGEAGARGQARSFQFDVITAAPLSRETWLAQVSPYHSPDGRIDWQTITAMPESDFLGEVQKGNSQVAVIITAAMIMALIAAIFLGGQVAAPLLQLAKSAKDLETGNLARRAPSSSLHEVEKLSQSFNHMADRLQESFAQIQAGRDALRQSSERLEIAARAADIGIWDWDVVNDRLVWDATMYHLYGIGESDFSCAYEAWTKLLHPQDKDRTGAAIRAALGGEREYNEEFRIIRPDGAVRVIQAGSQTFRDAQGRPLRMVGVNYDVTEDRARKEELRLHRNHLEDLVAKRTAELKVALAAAEEASRSKSTFLATMSHEIRTPMNGVLGMAELLSQTPLDAGQREQLSMLKGSGEVLLTVINDILDFSKIEAGRMEFEKIGFSLHEMLGRALQALSSQASAKGLELELEIPADLPDLRLGDPGRLRQVLTNLVGNAIKFTEHGWIRVVVAQGAGPHGLRVEVVDTGEGIHQEAQAKLFQPFSQADASTTRKHGGTGLGLVICARIIGHMGGRTGVVSQPGRGSTFWFELDLPLAAPQEVVGLEERMPETLPLLAGKSALVVDDNAVNRAVACAQMRRWGMRVAEAADAATALAQLKAASQGGRAGYDIAVLDGMMPGMDGWQLAAAIRQVPGCAALPLIMASSAGPGAGRMGAPEGMFRRFLQKPMRPVQLAGALAEVLTGWNPGKVNAPAKANRAARVLLVEDTVVNQRVARAMLERGGHRVTLAENGVQALALLQQPGLFDVVLMDCQMPEMDGFEATRQLRLRERERGWKPYRVVAMTANVMQGDQDLCLAAGMDDYLAKPVRMDLLLRTVALDA